MKLALLFVVIFATVAFGQVQAKLLKDDITKAAMDSRDIHGAVEIQPLGGGGVFSQMVEDAKEKGKKLIDKAKDKGKELIDKAKESGKKIIDNIG